ncbi:hypothetical protein [Neorhodopirellula pilleata]|uniref:Neutral/alkaline non-lysosomal ceramidase n=1 Tax=Neorhodopirellula pilleata TaxID=2714738 RepID=A0A5C5ZG36_9BACT|nr:hypothetical protein [Neorhodopirellula pilleata]TWT86389.1 hypothetical protein Pla100_60960 [Neorhodopirellula pilleata]
MNHTLSTGSHAWVSTHDRGRAVVLLRLMTGIVLMIAIAGSVAAVETRVFQAGASITKITPPLGLPIIGNWDSPPATEIHDDLHVRCLAFHDGKTTIVFAICDNVGIPREVFDQARKLLQSQSDVPPTHILMSSTHTHSGVSARGTR